MVVTGNVSDTLNIYSRPPCLRYWRKRQYDWCPYWKKFPCEPSQLTTTAFGKYNTIKYNDKKVDLHVVLI